MFREISLNWRFIMMKSNTLPTPLSVSGQRKKMGYKNGACNYGKLINRRY